MTEWALAEPALSNIASNRSALCQHPLVKAAMLESMREAVEAGGGKAIDVPTDIFLTPIEFTVLNGQLTTKLTLRREAVKSAYKVEIRRMIEAQVEGRGSEY